MRKRIGILVAIDCIDAGTRRRVSDGLHHSLSVQCARAWRSYVEERQTKVTV
jgi:hypothetical protein